MKRLLLATLAVLALSVPAAPPAAAADNCPFPGAHGSYHKGTATVRHTSLEGVTAYQIWLKGESCINRYGKVTAYRWNKWKYVDGAPANHWVWRSWDPNVNGGGIGYNHVYRRVEGNLEFCFFHYGCVGGTAHPMIAVTMTNSYPWIEVFVREM